jgi:uncharacterized protein (TIGR03000 family)
MQKRRHLTLALMALHAAGFTRAAGQQKDEKKDEKKDDKPAEKKPLVLEVLVPAEATVEIDGHKTKSTGEQRKFESPPVAVGKKYSYTLKVTHKGKDVTRKVDVGTDKAETVDFRKEFEEKPSAVTPPKGKYDVPGFVTFVEGDKLWVFKEGSKEIDQFKKDKKLEKPVTRAGEGPDKMTVNAVDAATIDAYLKAWKEKK